MAEMRIRGATAIAVSLLPLLAGSLMLAVVFGSVHIPLGQVVRYVWAEIVGGSVRSGELSSYRIVIDSRLPRALTAAFVGAAISIVGIMVQAMVRNELADPYVLGISSGASVGAVAVVLFGALGALGVYALSSAAFAGAMVATAVVLALARTSSGFEPLRLVLMGTTLGYGFSAITTVLVFLAPAGDAARNVMFWLLGSLAAADWRSACLTGAAAVVVTVTALVAAPRLNALAMGDDVAASLGVAAGRFRLRLFVLVAVVMGVVVSVCGAIGFVGLVLPHAARMLVGADHRRVAIVTPVLGAIFLVLADLVARTLVPPYELPIGAITAAVGVPVFVVLMRRRMREIRM